MQQNHYILRSWSRHMRVVGCQGRRIFSRLAACCKASELVDSSFDLPPPRGRMEAGHPGVDTVMPLSPSGFSHEQLRPHGRQPEQRRMHVSFVSQENKGSQPNQSCLPSSECSWIQAQISFSAWHAAESAQSFSKQTNEQAKWARATGNSSRGQVSAQTGRQISDGNWQKCGPDQCITYSCIHVPYSPLVRSSINDAGDVTANY